MYSQMMDWPYPVRYGKENEIEVDVLILGGGVAGCHAAASAAKRGAKVAVIEKGAVIRSGSGGAGVDHWHCACTNPCSKITPEEMTEEVKVLGNYVWGEYGNGITCYIQCKESYDALLDLEEWGVPVRDLDDEFAGAEFRDDKTKLMFAYDYKNRHCIRVRGGANIKPALYRELRRLGVKILDRVTAISLLNEGGRQGARVVGATGINSQTGEFYIFKSKATILTAGAPLGLWIFSTELAGSASNSLDPNNSGEGTVMAWKAGAELTLMERSGGYLASGGFAYPNFGTGDASATWYACSIVDANGKEIPWVDRDGKLLKTVSERYYPANGQKIFLSVGRNNYNLRGPSLIRDLPQRIAKGEYTLPLYADLPGMPELERKAIWGLMVGNEGKTWIIYDIYSKAGFDPDIDMLQVGVMPPDRYYPGVWWSGLGPRQWRELGFVGGGGLVFDWDLKTSLDGLYVAGSQNLAGGSHALSAATGRYAGRKAYEYSLRAKQSIIDKKIIEEEKNRIYAPVKRNDGIGWKELRGGLARIMQDYCGEFKCEKTLNVGLDWLNSIRESEISKAFARNPHELMRTLECFTRLSAGEIIMHASLARKASSVELDFKRTDYPELDPPEWNKYVTIRLENDSIKTGELPLNYWLLTPNAPTYEENYMKHCGQ